MSIQELRANWTTFGEQDPLWAILTHPARKDGRWDLVEFMATGVADVANLIEDCKQLVDPSRWRTALDFGCGVGRLTQALADAPETDFQTIVGVDIATSMIDEARRLNRYSERCDYIVNEDADLHRLESDSFDFILTLLVLQHMEPSLSTAYIAEFVRLLRPGGLAVFQLPHALIDNDQRPLLPGPDARRAELTCDAEIVEMAGGQSRSLDITVANVSEHAWSPSQRVKLANRWLSADAQEVVQDDGRTMLPPLLPGERCTLAHIFQAPTAPGRYVLDIDVVEELVAWFGDDGSTPMRFEVTISPATGAAPRPGPVMEMHAVPRETVFDVVERSGGRLLQMTESADSPDWISYRYFVTKAAR